MNNKFVDFLNEKVYSTKGLYDVPDMKKLKEVKAKELKFKDTFYAVDKSSKTKELTVFRVSETFPEAGWIHGYMAKNPSMGYRFQMDDIVYVVKL